MRYFKHPLELFYQELENGVLLVTDNSIELLDRLKIEDCSGHKFLSEIPEAEFNQAFENAIHNINLLRHNLKLAS